MAIQTEPTRIQIPFADSGTKNTIPDTNSTPSASQAASWTDGFPAQCSLPLSAGGIPPARADFNGILNAITQSERFTEEGGIWAWDATVDYAADRLVLGSDGVLYWSQAQSGPNTGAGAQDPTTDSSHTYWGIIEVPTAAVGNNSKAVASTQWVRSWYNSIRATTKYYVDPVNGSDSNTGESSSAPAKTYNHVLSVIQSKIGTPPSAVTIYLEAGTYGEILSNSFVGVAVTVVGPSSGVASFTQIGLSSSNTVTTLEGRIQSTGSLLLGRGAKLVFGNGLYLNFHDLGTTQYAMQIYQQGAITMYANANATIEYTGTNNFTTANVNLIYQGLISFSSITISGTVTGKRYRLIGCSVISGAGSATLFPGDQSGTTDSTSFYA